MGDNKQATSFLEKGLALAEKINQKDEIAECLDNLSMVYLYENPSKALSLVEKSHALRQEVGHDLKTAETKLRLGLIYKKIQEYELALEYFKQSKYLGEKYENSYFDALINSANQKMNQLLEEIYESKPILMELIQMENSPKNIDESQATKLQQIVKTVFQT